MVISTCMSTSPSLCSRRGRPTGGDYFTVGPPPPHRTTRRPGPLLLLLPTIPLMTEDCGPALWYRQAVCPWCLAGYVHKRLVTLPPPPSLVVAMAGGAGEGLCPDAYLTTTLSCGMALMAMKVGDKRRSKRPPDHTTHSLLSVDYGTIGSSVEKIIVLKTRRR